MARRGWRFGVAAAAAATWAAMAGGALAADESVGIYDLAFAPEEVTIETGESVTWSNGDRVNHTATGTGWDTGSLRGGASATVTFDAPGTYEYVCRFHGGMAGTVVVLAAGDEPTAPATDVSPAAPPAETVLAGGAGSGEPGGVPGLLALAALAGAVLATRRRASRRSPRDG